ncbi:MAG: hypothetical protein GX345_01415 [Clostridiales bacterium]|nr:hypothetical protein [Clostridiales bacterium]
MVKRKELNFLEQIKYELPIFFLLLIRALPQAINTSEDAYASLLSLSYSELGLAPRVVWGSFMGAFFDYYGARQIVLFFTPLFVIFLFLIAVLIGKLIRDVDQEQKLGILLFSALFLAGPYSVAPFEARLFLPDRLLAFVSVLGLVLFNARGFRWATPLIMIIGMATHQMFAFTYIPLFVFILLYELYKKGFKKSELLFFSVNLVTVIAATLYFYFAYSLFMREIPFEEMVKLAVVNTNLKVRGDMVLGYFMKDTAYVLFSMVFYSQEFKSAIVAYLKTFLFTLPMDIFFFLLWKKMYTDSKKIFQKVLSLILVFFPLAVLPLFPVSSEFYRLRSASVLSQFLLVFYLFYRKDETVLHYFKKISLLVQKHKTLALLILAYFAYSFASLSFSFSWSTFFFDFVVSSR